MNNAPNFSTTGYRNATISHLGTIRHLGLDRKCWVEQFCSLYGPI